MRYLLLTFDIEEFDQLRVDGIKSTIKEQCAVSADGLENVLDMLKKQDIKATFFTTYIFAKNASKLISRLIKDGHELGLHAYQHKDDYTTMDQEKAYGMLKQAKKEIERKFRAKITGFRGPQMKRPSYKVLKRLGFVYDSSLHPTWMPGHYNNMLKKRNVHVIDNVTEIPLSVAPIFRGSLAWIFFRNLPLAYSKIITSLVLADTNFVNLYLHPWEFTDIDKAMYKKLSPLIRRKTGMGNLNKLESYIRWCRKKGLQAETLQGYLKRML